jgi:ribosomal protein S18 acetylase RimI-like enzyme
MNSNGKIRSVDLRQDLDELIALYEACFAEEMASRGGDFREQLQSYQRIVPWLSFLGRFSSSFQHMFDSFAWEEDGRIVATVTLQKEGNDWTRWEIAMVATHPDYRRRGLAHKLLKHGMAYARAHGAEVCTLYVLAENTPAYKLYRSLGFVHYDSKTEFKLETVPEVQAEPANGYRLRRMKIGEWQTRYEVSCRETPQEVQDFLPVSQARLRVTALQRVLIPVLMRLQRVGSYPWAFEHDGRVVGYAHLEAQRTPQIPHRLVLKVEPAHRAALAEPALTLALETLQNYPRENLLCATRTSYTDLVDLLHQYGFVEIETQHWLGAKLEVA